MTQDEFANKQMVSRQAVTKWEADKGIPDVENLMLLSSVLGISIDYLLSDEEVTEKLVIHEKIDLAAYGKGSKKKKKDYIVKEKYPNAVIHTLMIIQKNSQTEKVIDNVLGFVFLAPFGIPGFINSTKHIGKEFYLVNYGEKQLLVMVTDEFIESREMTRKRLNQKGEKFEIGLYRFTNYGPIAGNTMGRTVLPR